MANKEIDKTHLVSYLQMTRYRVEALFKDWTEKADSYGHETFPDNKIVDSFITRFISYNALYFSLFQIKNILGKTKVKDIEIDMATKIFLEDFSAKDLKERFSPDQKKQLNEIKTKILSIIDENIYIYNYTCYQKLEFQLLKKELLKEDFEDKKKNIDSKIKRNLKDKDFRNNLIGLLSVIYQVRCNLFHGSKDLSGRQNENIGLANQALKIFIPKAEDIWFSLIQKYQEDVQTL